MVELNWKKKEHLQKEEDLDGGARGAELEDGNVVRDRERNLRLLHVLLHHYVALHYITY